MSLMARIQPIIAAIACGFSFPIMKHQIHWHHFAVNSFHLPQYDAISLHRSDRVQKFTMSVTSNAILEPLEVCVKASVIVPNMLDDCLFCQRVLLTMEEKQIPYDMKLVDLANKFEWFLKISPEGKVPVIKLDDKWIPDSNVITQSLEERFPDPPLGTLSKKASIGLKIFSTFISFLKSKDVSNGTEEALHNELSAFNDYIKENGPYMNGEKISTADLSLGPKLYRMEIALGHYKKWSVPESLPYVLSYMKEVFSSDSFIKTCALPEDVIAGWGPKVMG